MRFLSFMAGAVFMLAVCASWLAFRYLPQAEKYEIRLIQCEAERVEIISRNIDETMHLMRLVGGRR